MDVLIRGIPDEVHNKLKERAKNNKTTVTAEYLRILEWGFSDEPLAVIQSKYDNAKRELMLHQLWVSRVAQVFREIGFNFDRSV